MQQGEGEWQMALSLASFISLARRAKATNGPRLARQGKQNCWRGPQTLEA